MTKDKDFNQKRFRLVITLKELGYILLIIFLILLFIANFYYYHWITINFTSNIKDGKYLTFYLNESNYTQGLLLTFMISLMFLAYLRAVGFNIFKSNVKYRLILLVYFLYVFSLGFFNVGIGLRISENVHFLLFEFNYSKFESNSFRGIKFYVLNYFPLFVFLYFISYPFDSRRK